MRRRSLASFVAAVILFGAGASGAGVLTSATWTQVVSPLSGLPPLPITRTTGQLGATGSSTATSLSVSLSFPQFTTSFFVPKTSMGCCDFYERVSQGGPQAITATPGMGAGTPGILGAVTVKTASHVAAGVNQSMFALRPDATTLLAVPLGNGKAGQFTSTFQVLGQYATFTVDFFAWTPGTLSFMGLTSKGALRPDVVTMGSFDLTANGGGTVTLVAPTKLSANCALFQQRRIPNLSKLTLHFVPEPSTLLLLAAGALGLWRTQRRTN